MVPSPNVFCYWNFLCRPHNHKTIVTDWPSPMHQVRNQELKVKASSPHSYSLLGHFWLNQEEDKAEWLHWKEAWAARGQSTKISQLLIPLEHEQRQPATLQRPCSNFSIHKMWSLEQSSGMLLWLCICMHVCVYVFMCVQVKYVHMHMEANDQQKAPSSMALYLISETGSLTLPAL